MQAHELCKPSTSGRQPDTCFRAFSSFEGRRRYQRGHRKLICRAKTNCSFAEVLRSEWQGKRQSKNSRKREQGSLRSIIASSSSLTEVCLPAASIYQYQDQSESHLGKLLLCISAVQIWSSTCFRKKHQCPWNERLHSDLFRSVSFFLICDRNMLPGPCEQHSRRGSPPSPRKRH